jgi:NIMA-interacting peptidyl-prolyl cis-trans isomerase 1
MNSAVGGFRRLGIPGMLSAAMLSLAVACGGAPSSGVSTSGDESAAESCLASADAKLSPKASEPDRITVKHVLVRYIGSRGAPATVTRTRGQACLRAEQALAKLKDGTSFPEVVHLYSDESGGPTGDGSLGAIERGDVAPAFANAAFDLNVGEVSAVVETPFGFHVILRAE